MGWESNGEAWEWLMRLLVWEERLVRGCAEQLPLVVLQVGVTDRWICKLHSSHRYTVKSAYNILTTFEVGVDDCFNLVLWLKQIPLKVGIFIWCLFLNRLATKMNLFRQNNLDYNDSLCTATSGMWWMIKTIVFYLCFLQSTLAFDIRLARFLYNSSWFVNWAFYSVCRSWGIFHFFLLFRRIVIGGIFIIRWNIFHLYRKRLNFKLIDGSNRIMLFLILSTRFEYWVFCYAFRL